MSDKTYRARAKDLPEITVSGSSTSDAADKASKKFWEDHKAQVDPMTIDLEEVVNPNWLGTTRLTLDSEEETFFNIPGADAGSPWGSPQNPISLPGAVPQSPIGDDEVTQPVDYPSEPQDCAGLPLGNHVKEWEEWYRMHREADEGIGAAVNEALEDTIKCTLETVTQPVIWEPSAQVVVVSSELDIEVEYEWVEDSYVDRRMGGEFTVTIGVWRKKCSE